MKVLELFCGTKSISKAFKERGHNTFTIDLDKKFDPDICIDILEFDIKMLPKGWRKPYIIWASPPCTAFSVASIYRYWDLQSKPKSYKTYLGLAIAKKTIEIIKELKPKYYFIENPTGMLRKQSFMLNLHRKTVTYCQYGHETRKSTDIWTNASFWIPRKPCKPGSDCHIGAAMGKHSGVQDAKCLEGLNRAQTRAIIPKELCQEIVKVCEGNIKNKQETISSY